MIWKYFDVCFLINLDSRPDRLESATKTCRRVGIDSFIRIPGIRVTQADYPNLTGYGPKKELLPALGCGLSHRKCIEKAKELGARNCLILEDDIVWSNYFHTEAMGVIEELAKLDWDIAHFWSRHAVCEKVSKHWKKISGTTNAHAYGVNKSFFDRYLREYNPPKVYPDIIVDRFLLQVEAKKFSTIDNVAMQRTSFSDIRGVVSDISSFK